jgi:acetyl esterase
MQDKEQLDPWVAEWMAANPLFVTPAEDLDPARLELARSPVGRPAARQIADVRDREVGRVPIRVYQGTTTPTGVVVYFHGGGFVIGSIGLMDNVARELAFHSGAVVVSVGYRLAPEHPYPAALEDCESVTRWALDNVGEFAAGRGSVAVAGESAGGNLAAAVSLRLRDTGDADLAGQVLIYPAVGGTAEFPSVEEFGGLVLNRHAVELFWTAYSGGRALDADPYAVPLAATDLTGLPPALVILGGCDVLRDEGHAYAGRLRDAGVAVEEDPEGWGLLVAKTGDFKLATDRARDFAGQRPVLLIHPGSDGGSVASSTSSTVFHGPCPGPRISSVLYRLLVASARALTPL